MHVRHSLPPFINIGLFQRKFKEAWGRGLMIHIYISEKTHHLPLENKLSQIPQIFATPHRNSKTKHPRPIENPHGFFLITPRKSTSCLIDSGISACFFQHPLKFNVLNSLCLFFFWNRMVIKNMFG